MVESMPAVFVDDYQSVILRELIFREECGSTAIGRGIALPHCFSKLVAEPAIVFGISPEGVEGWSLDGRSVHFIFMLLLPEDPSMEIVKRQVLRNIKWLLGDRSLQDRLKAATQPGEILDMLSPQPVSVTV